VAQLSLFLKLLESESGATAEQLSFERTKILPDLSKNIQCGNSLVEYDISDLFPLTPQEEMKIKPFSFAQAFKPIMDAGGFDAIVGNPPYVRIQTTSVQDTSYFNAKYKSATSNYDIYCIFVERGLRLLKESGKFGYILPHRFFKTDYGEGIRSVIANSNGIAKIIDFDGYMVFDEANINTSIVILEHQQQPRFPYIRIKDIKLSAESVSRLITLEADDPAIELLTIEPNTLGTAPWIFISENEKPLWSKLNNVEKKLADVTSNIFQGLKTGSDSYFVGELLSAEGYQSIVKFLEGEYEQKIESELLKPLLKGGQMQRYYADVRPKRVLFPYEGGKLIPESKMREKYPNAFEYLTKNKRFLESREGGKMRGLGWYGYTRTQALSTMYLPKIITPDYYASASYCLDKSGELFLFGGGAGGYGIVTNGEVSLEYLIGLLNSRLLDWYLHKISLRAYQTAYMYIKKYIEQLPILLNENSSTGKKLVSFVDQMLTTKKQLATTTRDTEKEQLQRKCDYIDGEIDKLVYQLYGLTEAEIKIVEGTNA
jgi:hypothetical protein